jgi:hypothetical protein
MGVVNHSIDTARQLTNMPAPQSSSGALPLCRRADLSVACGFWRFSQGECGRVSGVSGHRLLNLGGVSRAAKGADCKSAGNAFVGSSPTSPTSLRPRAGRRPSRRSPVGVKPGWGPRARARQVRGARSAKGRRSVGPGGCSSMVEQQPSKLMTRVRFPSPAPAFAAAQLWWQRDEIAGRPRRAEWN